MRRRRQSAHIDAPTLHDVARAAGVSTASVSRALTRPELVSEALRESILRAAHGLAYLPNVAARTLSGRPSKLVGVVVATLDDPVAGRAIDALTRRLQADGWALMLGTAGDDAEAPAQRMRELVARGCDAFAFFGVAVPKDREALFPGRSVPYACIDEAGRGEALAVGFDRCRALALGARYLRELRHRRIGLFALGHARLIGGVRDALAGTDIVLLDAAAAINLQNGSALRATLATILALPARPTALLCGSDAAAAAVLRECVRQGVPVPGQLSLVGFGDTDLARQTRPGLTTIRVPASEAGIAAAEFLLAAVAGTIPPATERAVKLVVRDSTGPALT